MSDEDAVEVEQSDETAPDDADGSADDADENTVESEANDADGSTVDADVDAGESEAAADGTESMNAGGDDGREGAEPLADRVADHDEELAEAVAALETDLEEAREDAADAREEVEELTSKLARVRADFSNYKQRAKRKREEIRERASEELVERIAPVRNDLLRALDQEAGSDIRPGVQSTVEKFDDVLAEEGVAPIEPEPGAEVDPARHQVMLRVDSDQPEGTVHDVYEPGYEMGDRVISEAQVTVSDGEE